MSNITNFMSNIMNSAYNINVSMIGKIQDYDSKTNTATIIPLHMTENEEYQPLTMVPIGYFNLGGYKFKIKPLKGDIVILVFIDYDIDNILIDGQTKTANTERRHSLEDCIALPLSVNFLNNSYNASEDLTIEKEGGQSYIKITKNDEIIINSTNIKLGENAIQGVRLSDGSSSTKVFAE